MKTQYKYIYFKWFGGTSKTQKYACLSNSSDFQLGTVEWYGTWRQYCFFPNGNTVFNIGCLDDIKDFIRQLMESRRDTEIIKGCGNVS
jgi:hypothetical protein